MPATANTTTLLAVSSSASPASAEAPVPTQGPAPRFISLPPADGCDEPDDDRCITAQEMAHAERELADFYASHLDVRRHIAWQRDVEARLAYLRAHHRGVLALHHARRAWPEAVTTAFGPYASLAVRLDCAAHPAAGSTPALEAAAAERLAATFAKKGPFCSKILGLRERARELLEGAVRAYASERRLDAAITREYERLNALFARQIDASGANADDAKAND